MNVLSLNGGSSSLKVAAYRVDADGEERTAETEGQVSKGPDLVSDLRRLLEKVGTEPPAAIGHRLVHGGPEQFKPLRLTKEARARLNRAIPFAPLHLPSELALVDAALELYPDVPQVACFDTAFHEALPDVARRLPVAAWADEQGVHRYGFHGLSCEFIVGQVEAVRRGPAVIAHLGSGASLTAVRDGRSMDTTMGMTPTGGIMMGSRTGDLDPGALVYLMQDKKWSARDVEHFVNHECGLKGVSTTTSDMQALLEARADDPKSALAVDLFVYIARKAIGALAAALGGLSSVVFTGGIGAHAPVVRNEILAPLGFLGIAIEHEKNAANAAVVSKEGSAVSVHVVETNEELVIARHVCETLRS